MIKIQSPKEDLEAIENGDPTPKPSTSMSGAAVENITVDRLNYSSFHNQPNY